MRLQSTVLLALRVLHQQLCQGTTEGSHRWRSLPLRRSCRRRYAIGAQHFFSNCQAFYEVGLDRIASARGIWDCDQSFGANLDLRIDDVFLPVALGSRNISRQRKIGQRGHSDVVHASDASL